MDRLTSELLYQHLKGIAAELHGIDSDRVRAYVLITVTDDDTVHLSTNIMAEDQIRGLLARQALSRAPMVPQVPDGLF